MDAPLRFRDSGNWLLDRIPTDEYGLLAPHLQREGMELKQVIHQIDEDVDFLQFPTSALASALLVLEEEDPIEAATVGREGMLGVAAALGVAESPHRVICQMAGEMIRIPTREFLRAMARGPIIARLIRRYAVFSIRHAGQGIACNALHLSEARACRWLLSIHDQAGSDEFPLTQEFLALMLGLRRQGVTVIAGTLQNAGIISYHRGRIRVLDRLRLEDAACECYAASRRYYEQIMA
ncbi:Crp/Fnr family transcriptional regulator [Tundrisphaera sp. TA3]|uniref:Crp/Fnr family transcriptional regulator n=1 Tax=Tundrisphaera sp. TA3 TaxID=3435775 RepID=UPI003EBF5D37